MAGMESTAEELKQYARPIPVSERVVGYLLSGK